MTWLRIRIAAPMLMVLVTCAGGCGTRDVSVSLAEQGQVDLESFQCDPAYSKMVIESFVIETSPASPSISDAVSDQNQAMEGFNRPSPPSDVDLRDVGQRLDRQAQRGYSMVDVPEADRRDQARKEAHVVFRGDDHVEAAYRVVQTDPGGWVVYHTELCTPEQRAFELENKPPASSLGDRREVRE